MLNDYFNKMVQEMYDLEATVEVEEWETSRFTANIALKNLQMIDAIAARFKRSRAVIVEEILNHAAFSMFLSLDDKDREELAKQCDEQFQEKIQQIAADNKGHYNSYGLGNWAAINLSIEKSQNDSEVESKDA